MGRRWRRLGAGALAVLVAVAAVEAILRWGWGSRPAPGPPRPRHRVRVGPVGRVPAVGQHDLDNALGMRAPDPPSPSRPSDRRVLVIGDSVVYGEHRLDQSETVAARMTVALEADPALAGCRPIVLPMAVSSWGPINQAAFLARDGLHGADVAALVISPTTWPRFPMAGRPACRIGCRRRAGHWRRGPPAAPAVVVARAGATAGPAGGEVDGQPGRPRRDGRSAGRGRPDPGGRLPPDDPRAGGDDPARAGGGARLGRRAGLEVVDRIVSGPGPSGYRDLIHPNAAGADDLARELAAVVSPHLASCSAD